MSDRIYVLEDFDLCECADYRRQHQPGMCAFRCNCHGFKLIRKATEIPETYRKLNEGRVTPPLGIQGETE